MDGVGGVEVRRELESFAGQCAGQLPEHKSSPCFLHRFSYEWSIMRQEARPMWKREMGLGPRDCSPDCSEHLLENSGP